MAHHAYSAFWQFALRSFTPLVISSTFSVGALFASESLCEQNFEPTGDGGKRLTKECCKQAEYPKFSAFLKKYGIKISARHATQNHNSTDKKYYRCGVELSWVDPNKKYWVKDEANLKQCIAERKKFYQDLEKHRDKYQPKGIAINFTFLGWCSNDSYTHFCKMGLSNMCKN